MIEKSFSKLWLELLMNALVLGDVVAPRGKVTREMLQQTIQVDMTRPVLTVPTRKLSYTFMVAEAHWILDGDDRVSTIAPYNDHISNFSDDGERFFGAYGPKIQAQLPYVVTKLKEDPDTRQAGLNIWRESPPATKDVPCTVSIFFQIRSGELHCNVFMRSSDLWLGLPYDVFNFSMLAHLVAGLINEGRLPADMIKPGTLFLTAASSHLYQENFTQARECVKNPGELYVPNPTPDEFWQNPGFLMSELNELKDLPPGTYKRWWCNNK